MARFAQILAFSGDASVKFTALAATTASAAQFVGPRRIIVINADQDITIVFGNSSVAAPTTANYRIPANQQTTFDMGPNTHIRVFNNTATPANIYVQDLEGR